MKEASDQLHLFEDAPPPIPPKEERVIPATSWDRGAHAIHTHLGQPDIAPHIVRLCQGKVPMDALWLFSEIVNRENPRTPEEINTLLHKLSKDTTLHPILRNTISRTLAQEKQKGKSDTGVPHMIIVTRNNVDEAIKKAKSKTKKPR
ncbi:MAG: hypothetical protein K9M03_00100 [Kiritimatiellales bacterium]|nr:hypothetical protein [Kiritimatiellales bacterium]